MIKYLLRKILLPIMLLLGIQQISAQWTNVYLENFNNLTGNSVYPSSGGTAYWSNGANPPQNNLISSAATVGSTTAFTTQLPSDAAGGRFLFFFTNAAVPAAENTFFKKTITVVPGRTYRASYSYIALNNVAAANVTLRAMPAGSTTPFFTSSTNTINNLNWANSQNTFIVPAGVTSMDLTWENTFKVQNGNDFAIDNVLVEQALDSDNDGVPDYLDLDDDNDGIVDTLENSCAFEGSPVYVNTFGTGARTSDANVLLHSYTSSGTIADGFYAVTTSIDATNTYSQTERNGNLDAGNPVITAGSTTGRYLMINLNGAASLDQPIYRISNQTTVVGQRYRYRMDMAGLSDNNIPILRLSVKDANGNLLASTNSTNLGVLNDDLWRRLTLDFVATTTNVTIEIVNLQISSSGNDLGIDNIVLTPYFICDIDGDGIPNSLDLDSDGDGCTDAIEGGAPFTSSNLVTATGPVATQSPNQNLGNNVGSTSTTLGIPTAAGTGQTVAQSQDWTKNDCLDTDGDDVPNWQDLDDDNDGILDTVEDACATEGTPVYINTFGTGGRTDDPNVQNHTFVASGTIADGFYSVTTSGATSDTFSQTELNGNLDAGNPVITSGSTTGRYLMININSPATVNLPIYRVNGLPTAIGGRHRFRVDIAGLSTGAVPILILTLKDTSGNVLATSNSNNIGVANDDIWRRLTLDFVATTNSVVLEIVNMQSNGGGNDVGIDNIILTPIIICDNDGDGIPNSQDLDSDGDGCTDAIEGGSNFTNTNLVTATGTLSTQVPNQNLGNTVGNTSTTIGIPTIANTGQSVGQSQNAGRNDCLDSDGDGIPDWQDLDDDNDGILDTTEKGACGVAGSIMSMTGYRARVYNAIAGTDAWAEMNASTGFPTASFNQIATFDYKEFASKQNAFDINFDSVGNVSGTNSDISNYQGTVLGTPTHEYAILFSKIINDDEVGTYQYNLINADNHVFVYKNGVKVASRQNVYSTAIPVNNFITIPVVQGDRIDIVLVEEDLNNTYLHITASKTVGQCMKDTDGDGIPDHLDLDSDNDGCPDAIEGGANITTAQLVNAGGTLQGGNGTNPVITPTSGSYNQSVLLNICAAGTCVNASGVPQLSPLPTGYNNTTGQSIGDSQNALINLCYCYKKPVLDAGTTIPVQHGITALSRANSGIAEWPVVRQSAWTVLEANTKGFVVNRLAFEDADANASTPTTPVGIPAANYVEGMMVYDTVANCLKVYNGIIWNCYSTQACPQ